MLALASMLTAKTVTVEEAYERAGANYPLIQRYDLLDGTHAYTLKNIAKGWLPQVSLGAQATLQSDVVSLPDVLKSMMSSMGTEVKGLKKDQYKLSLNVDQTLYDGGAIAARRRTQQAEHEVEKANVEVDLYALRARVYELCFSWLLVTDRLALLQAVEQVLSSNENKLSEMVNGGIALEADRDAVRVERLSLSEQQIALQCQKNGLEEMLSLFCAEEIDGIERPAASLPEATNHRPELALFDHQRALLDERERSLRVGLLPRVSLFAQGFYGYPGYNMYEDMFSHDWSLGGMIGARVQWNIGALYTRHNDRASLAVGRASIDNARETFLFNTLLSEKREEAALKGYREMLTKDDEIIQLRESVRKSAEAKLAGGIIDVTSLVKEITAEHEAQLNKSTHEIELLKAIYSLKNIKGN